jgi:hypothetical protein
MGSEVGSSSQASRSSRRKSSFGGDCYPNGRTVTLTSGINLNTDFLVLRSGAVADYGGTGRLAIDRGIEVTQYETSVTGVFAAGDPPAGPIRTLAREFESSIGWLLSARDK